MLDLKFIEENKELVKQGIIKKNFKVDIDKLLELNNQRKLLTSESEKIKSIKNSVSKEIAKLNVEEKKIKLSEMQKLTEKEKELDDKLNKIKEEINQILLTVPNPPDESVPVGKDDTENVEIERVGQVKRKEEFEAFKDHIELGLLLDIVDFNRASKIAGSRTYYLKNEGVLLQMAIMRFALDTLIQKGFTPFYPPFLVKDIAMTGTGYFPVGKEQSYSMEKDELYLIGTSEVPLVSYHYDEVLDENNLPIKYAGYSSCFRREAGTYGKDTKGLYRIHQFEKIEQVIICKNNKEESDYFHSFILQNSKELLERLELPYRVVNVCTGDLGLGQVKKNDIECWMPSRDNYGETHSCSSFYDFQSRRSKIKVKAKDGSTYYPYTLNNTLIASPRILIPILEMNQLPDGSVKIPKVLVPYMNGIEFIKPKK
ncbi:MAG: serine--tRNA ligase [Spirochaetales bacterium]|jgi:seryl-tRNA synthetase|nr:serine--tRNA ligase [Exilispira sp.]NMC66801.1 serine--tRNA ligase [Spirochaetales bacterium]